MRFISNLSEKISAFAHILRLKNEAEFTWGQISSALLRTSNDTSSPVMKAPMAGTPFRLYIAAEDAMIGAVLTQVTEGKEHIIT
jgi:hypothetical protein